MSLQFGKLHVPAAYQVVSRAIRRAIVSGELKPGAHLPSETELALQFGVNRSTVREGIRQLENDGFVRRQGRKRLTVSMPTSSDLAPRATRALIMQQVTFRELWEVARVLEPACAALCAANRGDTESAAIAGNLARTRAALDDATLATRLDTEFHALVADGAHNAAMLLSREPVGMLLYPAFERLHPKLPQALGRMLEAHDRVATAISGGQAGQAELWMRKHIEDFRRGWELAGLSLDQRVTLPGSIAEE